VACSTLLHAWMRWLTCESSKAAATNTQRNRAGRIPSALLTIDQVGGSPGKALAPTLFKSLLDRGGFGNVSWKATWKGLLVWGPRIEELEDRGENVGVT
jgi:hypothetical protein